MEFRILKASDWNFRDKKTFSTIEELKDYINAVNPERKSCVIYFGQSEVWIYDSWIE